MKSISSKVGSIISFNGANCLIKGFKGCNTIIAKVQGSGELKKIDIDSIKPPIHEQEFKLVKSVETAVVPDEVLNEGKKIYDIIKPLIEDGYTRKKMLERCKKFGISEITMRRYLHKWDEHGDIGSLALKKSCGGRGKSRLLQKVDNLIDRYVLNYFTAQERKTIDELHSELKDECEENNLKPCSVNTFRARIRSGSFFNKVKKRYTQRKPETATPGEFPGGLFPLEVVQIDHTQADLFVIDSETRKALCRPWLTVAIDVFSRMIVGYYLSLDSPSAYSVGQCILNCVLRKKNYLQKIGVSGEWPVYGFPNIIHADNAKEFRGKMLKKACKYFNCDLTWRPVKKPRYGAHIERLIGTLMGFVHKLPGTTFSNKSEKDDYDSKQKACLTLDEFNKLLLDEIVNHYHIAKHNGIGLAPIYMWELGFAEGFGGTPPAALPDVVEDSEELRLNFLPYYERTIQKKGVRIDHHTYFHDVLRMFVKDGKKHLFRFNPYDIRTIFFWNNELDRHYPIYLKDNRIPKASKNDVKVAKQSLKERGSEVTEENIHKCIKDRKKYLEEKKTETHKVRLSKEREKQQKLVAVEPHDKQPSSSCSAIENEFKPKILQIDKL
jgi:putative transposase